MRALTRGLLPRKRRQDARHEIKGNLRSTIQLAKRFENGILPLHTIKKGIQFTQCKMEGVHIGRDPSTGTRRVRIHLSQLAAGAVAAANDPNRRAVLGCATLA